MTAARVFTAGDGSRLRSARRPWPPESTGVRLLGRPLRPLLGSQPVLASRESPRLPGPHRPAARASVPAPLQLLAALAGSHVCSVPPHPRPLAAGGRSASCRDSHLPPVAPALPFPEGSQPLPPGPGAPPLSVKGLFFLKEKPFSVVLPPPEVSREHETIITPKNYSGSRLMPFSGHVSRVASDGSRVGGWESATPGGAALSREGSRRSGRGSAVLCCPVVLPRLGVSRGGPSRGAGCGH